jgi:predicted RNA-binding protein with PUA-like domain
MAHWLIKSEPEVYSWDQLVKDKETRWDGIRNYAARLHLRAMKKGDQLFFYAYPDPTSSEGDWAAVDVKAVKKLLKPVGLDQIKKEKKLAGMALVRIGRLSVQPVTDEEWKIIMKMGGME